MTWPQIGEALRALLGGALLAGGFIGMLRATDPAFLP